MMGDYYAAVIYSKISLVAYESFHIFLVALMVLSEVKLHHMDRKHIKKRVSRPSSMVPAIIESHLNRH